MSTRDFPAATTWKTDDDQPYARAGEPVGRLVLYSAILLLAVMTVSCGGSKDDGLSRQYLKRIGAGAADLDRSIAALNPNFSVTIAENNRLHFGMTAVANGKEGSPEWKTLNDLTSVSFVVFDADGKYLDSLYTDEIERTGVARTTGTSLTANAGVFWRPDPPFMEKFRVILTIRTVGGIWIQEAVTSFAAPMHSEPIVLTASHEKKGSGLDLRIKAERLTETGHQEYLPTAEGCVMKLYDGPNLIWSSSDGQMFAQVKSTVEPNIVGEIKTFNEHWDGTDRSGQPVPAKALTLEALIPAVPEPYVIRKEIQWTGS